MTPQEVYDEFLIDEEYELENSPKELYSYRSGWNDGMKRAAIKLRDKFRSTTDGQQTGKWIRTGCIGDGNSHFECSNCHTGDVQADGLEVPYCWYCGAKMKKGDG